MTPKAFVQDGDYMKLFDKMRSSAPQEEYMDIQQQEEPMPQKSVVEVERLENLADTERLQKKVRSGSIMLIKIKELKSRDMNELKRAIDRVKKTVVALNGDIAGVGEDWILVTPGHAKIHREEPGAAN